MNLFNENTFKQVYEGNRLRGFHDEPKPDSVSIKQRLLALIISEASEALEALRKNKRADRKMYGHPASDLPFEQRFSLHIKDTYEDELADVCIRVFDYCGKYNLQYKSIYREYEREISVWREIRDIDPASFLFVVMRSITDMYYGAISGAQAGEVLGKVHSLALAAGIDLPWHIEQKLKYNETRTHKHGKQF